MKILILRIIPKLANIALDHDSSKSEIQNLVYEIVDVN
jgi:hypothetical protein